MCQIINCYITMSVLMFQDTVQHCTLSLLMNNLHTSSKHCSLVIFIGDVQNCVYRRVEVILNINKCNKLKIDILLIF